MTEKDDRLVNRFFAEYSEPVPDKGFSKKVMQNVPDSAWYLNRIWGTLCILAGITVFVKMKGWEILGAAFQSSFLHIYHIFMEKLSHVKLLDILPHFTLTGHTLLMFLAGGITVIIVLFYNVIMDEKEG
jgi:hypothetical protein